MFAFDRLGILADGPLTAVAALFASEAERKGAYSEPQARVMLEMLFRQDDRNTLVQMYRLLCSHNDLPVQQLATHFLTERLFKAVMARELLLVPGWHWRTGYTSSGDNSNTPEGRVVSRIMGQKAHLPFEGSNYAVVTFDVWDKLKDTGSHQLVHHEQAAVILERLGARALSRDQQLALQEAVTLLARTHASAHTAAIPLEVRDGLVLAKRSVSSRISVKATPSPVPESHVESAGPAPPRRAPAPPILHYFSVQLIKRPDRAARPNWWPVDPQGPYASEKFSADITDGRKDDALDGGAAKRYDGIPGGACKVKFVAFYRDIAAALNPANGG